MQGQTSRASRSSMIRPRSSRSVLRALESPGHRVINRSCSHCKDGKVLTGLVRSETETEIELVDADAQGDSIPKDQVEERRVSDVSLMPKGLVDTLTPVEFADLISYLQSLKTAPAASHVTLTKSGMQIQVSLVGVPPTRFCLA